MDLKKGTPPTRITTGKNFLYSGSIYNGRLYIVTNEDAPRYRVFAAEAGNYERDDWKEIIPQSDAVLQGAAVWGGKLFAQYEQNANFPAEDFRSGRNDAQRSHAARDGHGFRHRTGNGIAMKFFMGSCPLRFPHGLPLRSEDRRNLAMGEGRCAVDRSRGL